MIRTSCRRVIPSLKVIRRYASSAEEKSKRSIEEIALRSGVKPIVVERYTSSCNNNRRIDEEKLKILYKEAAQVFGRDPKQLPLEAYQGNEAELQAQRARHVRKGSKVLSSRLKGPAVSQWYNPPDTVTGTHLRKSFPFLDINDPKEEYRLNMVETRKRRGKGAPKKKRQETEVSKKKKGK